MKKRAVGYKKYGHRALSMLLAIALLFAFTVPTAQMVIAETPNVETVQFYSAADADKFDLYSTGSGGFTVANGQLTPIGDAGEFKAIYKSNGQKIKAVSVQLHPVGVAGPIFGGLYINASNAANGQDQINAINIGIESHFTGWSDARNRIDLVVGQFPVWAELQRTISETGNNNNLFTGGKKEPITLRAELDGNKVTMTVSLVSNPDKKLTATYYAAEGVDLALGDVGIRSHHNNACYDNFTVEYEGESDEEDEKIIRTDTVDFEEAADQDDFRLFHSSAGGFAVNAGKLAPTGASGEFKAIYNKPADAEIQSVSVELYPGASNTIVGGLYIGVKNPADPVDQVDAIYVGLESHFTGWSDARNRIDILVGQFPVWAELQRTISETGSNNNLFTGGKKAPLKLKVEIDGNKLLITLSLVDNPAKFVTTTYTVNGNVELSLGDVGIRSPFNDATYDNFTVTMAVNEETPEETEPEETEPEETLPEVTEPEVTEPVPTDLVDFAAPEDADKFNFYHSSNGGLQVSDGKLVPTGESGEFKAIYKDTNAKFSYISLEIHPGVNGFKGGIYIDVTDVDHPVDQIDAFAVFAEGNHSGWEDAPNRTDLVIAGYPVWTEYHRLISETGAGNALFSGGVREPIKMTVAIDGNQIHVIICLLSDPTKAISATYAFAGVDELGLGNVGIYSGFSDCSFDNFAVAYETVEEDKEFDPVIPEPEQEPTDLVDFESAESASKFDFYHSSAGGLQVVDGKLVPQGETGEFKAIYRDGGSTIQSVSVDIYPGESGQINSGLYIGASTVRDGVDMIKGLTIMVESNHSGWDDAVNRIDLVVGRFPVWRELHRYISETGNGNALFVGQKEPLRLKVDIDGNEITIRLSLISDPNKYVMTSFQFTGATNLAAHNVGLRSAFNDVSFDDFKVYSTEGGGSADPTEKDEIEDVPDDTGNQGGSQGGIIGGNTGSTPDTGDDFKTGFVAVLMIVSAAALTVLILNRKRFLL